MLLRAALRFSCLALLFLLARDRLDAQSAAMPAAFRTSAQMVLVPVTVTDHNGKTIEGLRAEDFNILEDQVPQQIVSFTSEDAPCSVGLVLDISGSMRNTLDAAKGVAQSFFQTANPEDEFLLLTVSTQPEAVSGFTTDIAALEENIERTSPGGMTALIDTVYLGLNRMRKARQPRRALLILSDGMDNYSRYSKSELMRVALEADVQIYTIIVDNAFSRRVNRHSSIPSKPHQETGRPRGRTAGAPSAGRACGQDRWTPLPRAERRRGQGGRHQSRPGPPQRVRDRISALQPWSDWKMAPGSCQIECAEGEYLRAQRILLALAARVIPPIGA